ncbi:MAG: VCBS repeat-containing protein [Gammaproteobacteria bacterium]|nr:VCBS repeat-containing protein [Gammaproteobacteria bacterium]
MSFKPSASGARTAQIEIKGNVSTKVVALKGTAVGPKKFTVSIATGGGGTVQPSSASVASGQTAEFNILPAKGYKLASVSGCGGTLKGSVFVTATVTANCRVSLKFVLDPPFAADAKLLRNLEPLYVDTCGSSGIGRSMQNVIAADFNKDGRKDLAISVWCSPVQSGVDYSGPTPSRVYVLTQDSSGNFIENTSALFGLKPVDLGGVAEYYVMSDFNRDGFPDIVYAVQREDGRRINSPPTNQYAFNVALMSRGDGRYEAEQWGSAAWHSQLVLVENRSGGLDVVETNFNGASQGWRWSGRWDAVPGLDWISGTGALFASASNRGNGSELAVTATNGSLMGVEARKPLGDRWTKTSEFGFPSSVIQKQCCGNPGPTPAAFLSIDGKDYIDASFGLFCEMRRNPDSAPEVLVDFNAQEIVGGYKGQVIVYGESELIGTDKLFSFSFDESGNLARKNLTIRNELSENVAPVRMSCNDFNSDGYQDILIYSTPTRRARKIVLYINDRAGSFDRVDESVMPAAPSGETLYSHIFEDLDGDGIRDLVYFPITTPIIGGEIRIRVHRGLRPVISADIK